MSSSWKRVAIDGRPVKIIVQPPVSSTTPGTNPNSHDQGRRTITTEAILYASQDLAVRVE